MNAQTIPRTDKVIKRAFLPKLDYFILADYSNLEFRMLGYYMAKMGDTSVADAFEAGRDLHQDIADALGITRDEAKTFNYSMMYGGNFPTVMAQFGCTKGEAMNYLRNWHSAWPGISLVQNAINEKLDRRGYITTLWGRHLHPRKRHSALNALIQGCSADLMRDAIRKLHRKQQELEWESHLVLSVHDSALMDVLASEAREVADTLPIVMGNDEINAVVPLVVDLEWSDSSWAFTHKLER